MKRLRYVAYGTNLSRPAFWCTCRAAGLPGELVTIRAHATRLLPNETSPS